MVSACHSVKTGFLNPIPCSQDLGGGGGGGLEHHCTVVAVPVLLCLVIDATLLLTVPVLLRLVIDAICGLCAAKPSYLACTRPRALYESRSVVTRM